MQKRKKRACIYVLYQTIFIKNVRSAPSPDNEAATKLSFLDHLAIPKLIFLHDINTLQRRLPRNCTCDEIKISHYDTFV